MTDRIAIWLFGLIVLALIVDFTLNGGEATLFMAQKLLQLITYLAFWR